jgi:hypothetical protein
LENDAIDTHIFYGKGEIFCMPRKRKQAKQATPLPNPLLSAGATTPVPPVALLIDGENAIIPDLIAYILVEAGKMGGVTVRQIYGNWATPSMQPWKKHLAHYSLEPLGNRPGHNATDIALVIGAMDLLYRGIKHFCLVAGDSDYVPLISRLRQSGCTVLVIGTSAASNALKDASSMFLSTSQLIPQVSSQPSSPQTIAPPKPLELSALLTKAYHVATQKSETEWVPLSLLGLKVRELSSTFEMTYGKQNLSNLVKQCNGCFDTRKRKVGKGQVEEVHLRGK